MPAADPGRRPTAHLHRGATAGSALQVCSQQHVVVPSSAGALELLHHTLLERCIWSFHMAMSGIDTVNMSLRSP